MSGKKKSGKAKVWTIAGEQVYPARLSVSEEQTYKKIVTRRRNSLEWLLGSSPELTGALSAISKRETVAKGTMGFFLRQFEGKFQRIDIVEQMTRVLMLPEEKEGRVSSYIFYIIGAAMWFLDYVKSHELEEDLYPLLPEEPDEHIELNMPVMMDFAHSNDEIMGVMTLIRNRNKEHRRAFKKLCALVDSETVANLQKTFRDTLLDYVERYLEICTQVSPHHTLAHKEGVPLSTTEFSPNINPLSMNFTFDQAAQAKEQPEMSFLFDTQILVGKSPDFIRKHLYYRKSSDLFLGFKTPNPYDICAAYLFLEKDGDALASLDLLVDNVLIFAAIQLPWGLDGAFDYGKPFEERTPDDMPRYSYHPWENAEEECVPAPNIEAGDLLTEGQLFYLATGYILPRDRVPSRKLKKWFEDQGLTPERAACLAWGAYFASCVDDLMAREIPVEEDFEDSSNEELGEEESEKQESEKQEDSVEKEDYSAREAELNRQLKAAQNALHAVERESRLLQKKLQEAENESMRDRTELSRLRETLYTLKAKEENPEEEPEREIQFPYQTERRIAAFGGHDTWLKAIRPLLPGVRFFDREAIPDVNTVKNADVVWIQANAMPHKLYYKIINAARKDNIPVRYFGYAGARKCAEQLVMDELSAG